MLFTEEQVLEIVDSCFHFYASSFRNDAKEYTMEIMGEINSEEKGSRILHRDKPQILSIDKGCGGDSEYYKVGNNGVTEIKKSIKPIEYAEGEISKEVVVYQVYCGDLIMCEIEANSCLSISYYSK